MPCPDPAGCPRNDKELNDYHGLNMYTPARVYTPRTKGELVAAVVDIESGGLKAKAVGSYMSLSSVARADDCAILTDQLDKQLGDPFCPGTANWTSGRFRHHGAILD